MTEQVKHTPTPWKVENNGSARSVPIVKDQEHIASVWNVGEGHGGRHANAAHIVRCVNSHDALVQSVKQLLETVTELTKDEACDHAVGICWCGVKSYVEDARAALRDAGEEVTE